MAVDTEDFFATAIPLVEASMGTIGGNIFAKIVGDGYPPAISGITPAAGTAIFPTTTLQFDVVDNDSAMRLVMVTASFAGFPRTEVIYDGTAFVQPYVNAETTAATITNGLRFQVKRNGGWPGSPTLTPYAVDVTGNEDV